MMAKKPETPEEQWKAIVDFADEREARELEDQTDEEADAVLKAHGVDLDRFNREGDAFVERLLAAAKVAADVPAEEGISPPVSRDGRPSLPPAERAVQAQDAPNVVPLGDKTRLARWAVWLVATALAATGVGIAVARREAPPEPVHEVVTPPDAIARELRQQAKKACDLDDWEGCIAKLDSAKALDPAGESLPMVVDARAQAAEGLRVRDMPKPPRDPEPPLKGPRPEGDKAPPH